MPRRQIPIVIRKSGEKFVPTFPVELDEGDQFIVALEQRGWRSPKDGTVLNGYTDSGPIISD